jgi:hypothetical protein
MISAEDMFERIDHWANNAMPITARTEVIKVKVLSVQLPNRFIIVVMSIIKTAKLMNFKIGLILYFLIIFILNL